MGLLSGCDGTFYLAEEPDVSLEKYQKFLQSRFGDYSGRAFSVFPVRSLNETAPAIDKIITVAANAEPARFVAQSMRKKKSNAYLYQFTRLPGTAMARKMRVHHGVDLAYVFGNVMPDDGYDETDRRLSEKMMTSWVNFARTGNPNGPNLKRWPSYESASDLSLEFGIVTRVQKHLYRTECDFISGIPRYPEK